MNNQNKIYLVIGIAVVVSLLFFAVGRKDLEKQNMPSTSPPPEIDITQQQSSTDTSNWAMYSNTTFGYSIQFPETYEVPPQTDKEKSQLGIDNNISVKSKSDPSGSAVVIVDVSVNSDNLSLGDYMDTNSNMFGISGPLVSYDFNGHDSLFNRNQPGTNVFVKRGQYIYHITAPKASQDTEIGDILTTFKFTQ